MDIFQRRHIDHQQVHEKILNITNHQGNTNQNPIVISSHTIEVPQNIKNRTTIQFSNSTSGYLSKGNKNTNSIRYMHPHVHCSIIHNSQGMDTT